MLYEFDLIWLLKKRTFYLQRSQYKYDLLLRLRPKGIFPTSFYLSYLPTD